MRFNAKIIVSGLLSVSIAILLAFSGMHVLLEKTLEREARLTGMDWAVLIEDRLSDFVAQEPTVGNAASTALPTRDDLRHLAMDVFAIGHMYQIDYINIACYCHVSLNLIDERAGATPDDPHAGHDHSKGTDGADNDHRPAPVSDLGEDRLTLDDVSPVPRGLWNHVLRGTSAHANPQSNQNSPHQFPLDRVLATNITQLKTQKIIIHHSAGPDFPKTFAEVYHPVKNGDDVLYLLRVIVDLEDQAVFYQRFMVIAAASSTLFLALVVAYPSWQYVGAARKRRIADNRVHFLANHDVLTNLYNRNNFHESASEIMWYCRERGQSAQLFLFDLNGFKEINDYHGHPVGDRLLCEFAALLRKNTPKDGYIARLGGDEFVVIVGGIIDEDFNANDILTLPHTVEVQVHGSGQVASATIAGGAVRYPRDAETTEELLQLADLALYAAKSARTTEVYEYSPDMKKAFFDRLKVRDEFLEALKSNQVEPYYQPIINIKTGAVESLEALARWNHPEKGILTPFVFSEVFNDSEICAKLGQVMFRNVMNDMAFWKMNRVAFNKVGVNVTDGDLKPDRFADDILQALEHAQLSPSHLTIEVTETCLFGPEKANSLSHLMTLRSAGCSIALDDFGTGFSSITQLKELPITRIKIDKSFIDDVHESSNDQSIISAMLDLGKSMNFDLVMEGIETSQQLSFLTKMGSELAQGYYYSPPIPAAEIPAFIERQNSSYDMVDLRSNAGWLRTGGG